MSAAETVHESNWRAFRRALASGDEAAPYVLHRLIGYPFFLAAIKMGIKPNYLTLLSLLFSLVAAGLWLVDDYKWLAVAVVSLNLGLAVDTIDGQVAPYRNEASEFGAWLSALGVIVKTIAIWSCVSIGVYWQEAEPVALILGIIALGHFFLAYYLTKTNKAYGFYLYQHGAVAFTRTRRMGLEISWVTLLTLFALANQLYLLLIIFTGVGVVPWSILILRAVQSNLRRDMESANTGDRTNAGQNEGGGPEDAEANLGQISFVTGIPVAIVRVACGSMLH